MIVPRYWAEARRHERIGRRRVTLRRFGWSDAGESEAQAMAESRAEAAMAEARRGATVAPRERRVPYNGAEGMPIREEILGTHGSSVITRNSYGAHCLNTPDVFFADLDAEAADETLVSWVGCLAPPALGLVTGLATGSLRWGATALIAGAIATRLVTRHLLSVGDPKKAREKARRRCRQRFDRWMAERPDWRVRLYETPAGFRVLVTSARFDPASAEVARHFADLGTDKTYMRMCQRQRCFRARLTAKPWRARIDDHMVPRPGVWPVAPDRLPRRAAWITRYETIAKGFAACRFLGEFGSGPIDPQADAVRQLHDEESRALSDLPMA